MKVRKICDEAEGLCPPALWTLATYSELLFLDTYPEAGPYTRPLLSST